MSACVLTNANVSPVKNWLELKSKENISAVSSIVPHVMTTSIPGSINATFKWLNRPNRKNKKRKKKKKRGAVAGLATLEANGESMDIDQEEKPPFMCSSTLKRCRTPKHTWRIWSWQKPRKTTALFISRVTAA